MLSVIKPIPPFDMSINLYRCINIPNQNIVLFEQGRNSRFNSAFSLFSRLSLSHQSPRIYNIQISKTLFINYILSLDISIKRLICKHVYSISRFSMIDIEKNIFAL